MSGEGRGAALGTPFTATGGTCHVYAWGVRSGSLGHAVIAYRELRVGCRLGAVAGKGQGGGLDAVTPAHSRERARYLEQPSTWGLARSDNSVSQLMLHIPSLGCDFMVVLATEQRRTPRARTTNPRTTIRCMVRRVTDRRIRLNPRYVRPEGDRA